MMTTQLPFYIVDVFAETRFAGNQLAVIRGAADLSTETMQTIAKEMNFSETTFIRADEERDGGYDVRIFTPAEELPFAGHPTLGTAYVIQREILGISFEQIVLNCKAGQIPVTFTYRDGLPDVLWMRPQAPQFGSTVSAETVAEALGLEVADLDSRFPVQMVSTGVPFLIVPLRTLDAVRRVQANPETYLAVTRAAGARWMLFFSPETYHSDHQLNARMIFTDRPG
ncbi:MAG: PhzF family phenazine biosynthesis protein, partial [Anaerolineae bacterium]|nr:PhzF family phenazine biosynthesis protein [Anaerolineae bacterium]